MMNFTSNTAIILTIAIIITNVNSFMSDVLLFHFSREEHTKVFREYHPQDGYVSVL